VLPLAEGDTQLDALMVRELTHLLVSEIILPGGAETAKCRAGRTKGLRATW
jgi:hypothetical protein